MLSFPNAKINIGLQIIEKRKDGFHNIESIFYPIDWKDVLEIIVNDELKFTSSGLAIPGDVSNNLCLKAYNLLKSDFDIPNVHIHLHKVIPMGAGMGGGSSDGAFTLKMLNTLFLLNLSNETLEHYAKQLGSDCAFFILNEPIFCYEKGDVFSEIELNLKGKFILVINPNIHVSTAEAYSGVIPQKSNFDLKQIGSLNLSDWKNYIKNDFEENVLKNHPKIDELKTEIYKIGAKYASMTGSGSTVYGIFEEMPNINNILNQHSVWVGNL